MLLTGLTVSMSFFSFLHEMDRHSKTGNQTSLDCMHFQSGQGWEIIYIVGSRIGSPILLKIWDLDRILDPFLRQGSGSDLRS